MKRPLVACLICSLPMVLGADLPRSEPEAQGVSSTALLGLVDALDKVESINSVMVVRHGRVIAEGWWSPYNAEAPHSLYSLSKSFTSTAVGLAIAEGKLKVSDPVLKFFPEDAPEKPSKNLQSMRVADLLRMSTGQQAEPKRPMDQVWTKVFLAQDVPFKPGTHFLYNTSATYMLSAIVQKATGQTVLDYLKPRLFEPLDIKNPTWESSPQGISTGGYGLSVRTEDIAKFGQLYLQKGKWDGKQLVPASWVQAATARQTSNGSNPESDWDQGYGYQFWRCRHHAFRGDGAFGQFCVVIPEHDAVVAITSGVKNLQSVLDVVWEKLLPAFQRESLEADEAAVAKLRGRLGSLAIRPIEGADSPSTQQKTTYVFPKNERKLESITLEGRDLILRTDGAERRITCGNGQWTKGRFGMGPLADQPAAASGGWTGDDTFEAKVCFYETPFIVSLKLKFSGNQVTLDTQSNVGFGATKQPTIVGKAE